jgi:hypothetical protein
MVQENTNPEEPEKKPDNSLFSRMSSISPPREVGDIGGIGGGDDGGNLVGRDGGSDEHGTLEDRMNSARKKSDIQIVIEKLFPEFPQDWLNKVLVSRVFPDAYNHLLMMGVKELVSTTEMSVVQATMYMNSVLSMAIDGESRIDAIHIVGRGAEIEETKAKNSMGIP